MVSITSRQVAPFQALLNMIKINYLGKSEVFKALIAVLCDYDQDNPDSISKTLRYIRILLTGNPDLAECLISFLPQPISLPKDGTNHPMYQPGGNPTLIKPNGISRPRERPTHHHIHPSQKDIKPIPTMKDCPCLWCVPKVKESFQNTGFTNTASIRDVKMVTASELGHDETSPHPRPLMVPHPGGAADHFHVIRESGNEAFPIRPELVGTNPPPFQTSLTLSDYPVHHHGLSVVNPAEEKKALDLSLKDHRGVGIPWMKSCDLGVQIHPLLQSANSRTSNSVPQTLVCGIKQGINLASQKVNSSFRHYITDPQREHGVGATDISPLPPAIGTYCKTLQVNPLKQANSSLHISPEAVSQPHPVNKPSDLNSSLPRLLNQGLRPLAKPSQALSHLLGMTKVSPTTSDQELRKNGHSSVTDDHIPLPPRKVPRLKSPRAGLELESLKELTCKLKVAESNLKVAESTRAIKQSVQYANMIHPVLENQSPVRFRVSGIPFKIVNPKQQCLDQGHTRSLTSFPYMQQIILPDGDVRTLSIDNSANKTEMSPCEHQNVSSEQKGSEDHDGSDQRKKRKHKAKNKKVKRKAKSGYESV